MRRPSFFISLLILSLFSTGTADACGSCVTSMLEYVVPSVLSWCLFSSMWLLALSLANEFGSGKVEEIPRLFITLLLILGAFLAGAAMLGPLPFLGLLVWALYVAARVLSNKIQVPRFKNISLKIISVSGLVVFAGLALHSAHIRQNRTDIDFMVAWPSSPLAYGTFSRLKDRGAKSLPEFRELLTKDDRGRFRGQAAEQIGKFGEPEKDVPLLISALAKDSDARIEAALQRLTGFSDLPEGTSYKTWEERWNREQDR